MVAIGASAGGLDAFKRFIGALPADSGMAFVLVPHLDPTHESLMVELLTKQTRLPVLEARHDTPIEPNTVYIIPPNRYLAIRDGVLDLSEPPAGRGTRTAIDACLRSLAADQKEKAIGIIFSGTGSHGCAGIREIKAAGGMVMVQDPGSAEYDQMPRNAIATGVVDCVLPPEKMPAALIDYTRRPNPREGMGSAEPAADESDSIRRVLETLHARTKADFRCYRKSMLMRRVHRRMDLLHLRNLADYLQRLHADPDEVRALQKDLQIGVTEFFREPETFEVLAAQVLPGLVQHVDPDHPLRVWVCGCATGEEAYTFAILLIEAFAAALSKNRCFQIFATDLDEASLEVARRGIYGESLLAELSPQRLQRFFVKAGDQQYEVSKQLRDSVVFATHNVLADPPFSRLDIISCRNVLIYLDPEVQAKVLQLFNFALRQEGYLLLGSAESIGRAVDLFAPLGRSSRVYRRLSTLRSARLELPLPPPHQRTVQPEYRPAARIAEVMRRALSHFAPASVLIDRGYQILSMEGRLVDYLEFPAGEPTSNLLDLTRPGLRTKVRTACQKAIEEQTPVLDSTASVRRNGLYHLCSISVRPILEPNEAQGSLLVVFQERARSARQARSKGGGTADSLLRQAEDDLRATREDFQGTIEELENANEDLKASNEEVMSMNEELQTSNEELESSKEELQSLNEELNTVNNQLQEKVDELDSANGDLTSLLDNTEVATLFLDADLCVKRFTPGITKLLNLRGSDVGRPIGDLSTHLRGDALLADCRGALEKRSSIERRVESIAGDCYLQRVFPYRSAGGRIDGLIVTFTDESQLTDARRRADESETYRTVLEHLPVAAVFLAGNTVRVNRATETLSGYRQEELAAADGWFATLFGARKDEVAAAARHPQQRDAYHPLTAAMTRKDGTQRSIELHSALVDGIRIMVMLDVTDRHALQPAAVASVSAPVTSNRNLAGYETDTPSADTIP